MVLLVTAMASTRSGNGGILRLVVHVDRPGLLEVDVTVEALGVAEQIAEVNDVA
jgi:hypothetical protein